MEKILWALAISASVFSVFYAPSAVAIIIKRNPLKRINIPFIILSLNIFIFSIFNFILLMNPTSTALIDISAKILAFITILILPVILHLVIRFTQIKENKRYKIYIGLAYTAGLVIFAIALIYNQVSTISTFYGYIIYSPFFRYMGAFYILPIILSTFFLTGRSIYRKLKTKESNLQVYYLLTGLLIYFIGTSLTQVMMELGILQPIPTNELAHILLYIFIASSLFVTHSSMKIVTEERIMGNIGDAVILFNNEGEVMEMNETAGDILKKGFKDKKIEKRNISDVLARLSHLMDKETDLDKLSTALSSITIRNYNDDFKIVIGSRVKYYNIRLSMVFNYHNRIMGKLLILSDITARKEKENQLRYQSNHDKLTGIFNRYYFEEELERLNSEKKFPISIIIGDINGLKLINDAFGSKMGDELIKKITETLQRSLPEKGILCRYGGDEFSIILPETNKKDSIKLTNRMIKNCEKSSTNIMPLNISFGFSIKKNDDISISAAVKEAEDTMNEYKLSEGRSMRSSVILSLKKALEERDYETEEHANRLVEFSLRLGKKVKLEESELNKLRLLALLHDIGKISIPDNIVLKPGKLTAGEWKIMKKHSEIGYRIAGSSPDLAQIASGILYHHEKWDGSGYPKGLKGGKIPIISRILSITDSYDAMISERPYKKAIPQEEALKEIKRCAGTQFDPYLVNKFLEVLKEKHLIEYYPKSA